MIGVAIAAPPFPGISTTELVIFDSRIPESVVFAMGHPLQLDIADLELRRWDQLRKNLADLGRVTGLTGWSDWIVVRGLLQERGMRLQSETPVLAPVSGKAHLFRWEMA